MSKSHKSRGRGGLARHIKIHPARQSSGRTRRSWKQPSAGASGLLEPTVLSPADPGKAVYRDNHAAPPPEIAAELRAKGFVSLDELKERIVRPGMDKHLQPLRLYRGNLSAGRVKMLWNFIQLAHLSGTPSAAAAVKLFQNPEVPQLLGPVRNVSLLGLETFLSRMHDNMQVAENIPGLPEYIREQIRFRKFNLTKISGADRRSHMDFRREAWDAEGGVRRTANIKAALSRQAAKPAEVFYPFLIHDPKTDESDLVKFVNSVVPRGLMFDVRADVCQEMLLAILTGEIARDEAHSKRYTIIKRVMAMNGISDHSMSLSTIMPGHSQTLGELLVDSDWMEPWEEMERRLDEEDSVDA